MNVLLVGKTPAVVADVVARVDAPAVTFFTASNLDDGFDLTH